MEGTEEGYSRGPAIVKIAVCGCGEIATKAHIPSILRHNHKFHIAAVIDPNRTDLREFLKTKVSLKQQQQQQQQQQRFLENVPVYQSLTGCLNDSSTNIDAVAVCTPPSVTLDLAEEALLAGKHVMVEKPPGDWRRLKGLEKLAQSQHISFFTAYHTAACVGLQDARDWLRQGNNAKRLDKVHVTWKESVRKWHPGQVWVTKKSSTNVHRCDGVLDMVFNPLSLLFALLSETHVLEFQSSRLNMPSNWETPISGSFTLLASPNSTLTATTTTATIQNEQLNDIQKEVPVTGDFAWDYEPATPDDPEEVWTIDFYTSSSAGRGGVMSLKDGGSQLYINGQRITNQPTREYPLEPEYENLYQLFSQLITKHRSAVDDTTPQLMENIQTGAVLNTSAAYDLSIKEATTQV